ncbi:MAG: 4-alpha-glucanotransferase [Thermodesulfobacteriota bacterium]
MKKIQQRASGILLHPTSLPGRHGIGDLGAEAKLFVDFLVRAGQTLWQVLPLGPTGYGDSPYQCFSAFAGNPLLISLEGLVDEGLLGEDDLRDPPGFAEERVDYAAVIPHRMALLERAAQRFHGHPGAVLAPDFDAFCRAQAHWLDDFALFMALKEENELRTWSTWPRPLARRDPQALAAAREEHAGSIFKHKLAQFLFFRQWAELRRYANRAGVRIIGDIPIFVAYDSADVWAHRELFFLDDDGKPTVVAGVPPDYFSATGQLWGNPLYRWDVLAREGYAWWMERLRMMFAEVDILRIDHFIGIQRYWEIPARAKTAVKGRYRPGPGAQLLQAARDALGDLPIIAEDLGAITPDVEELRDAFELPGMKLLQFAFDSDATNPFLPHNYPKRCVAYTGTHDNDTTVGWFHNTTQEERSNAQRYFARSGEDIAFDFIRGVMGSVADTAIVPMQDVLCLGTEARMNYPGRPSGNWQWRFRPGTITDWHVGRLAEMAELYGRAPEKPGAVKKPSAATGTAIAVGATDGGPSGEAEEEEEEPEPAADGAEPR